MEPLPLDAYRDLVARALAEDLGAGDVTSQATVGAGDRARGVIFAKTALVLAGLDIAEETFRQCDAEVSFAQHRHDGDHCDAGTAVAEVVGRARALLTAERTALNFLQRLSGIATETRRYVDAAEGKIIVLDTRKTTPTLRELEKYAVRCGGGTNHRYRLDDGVLIKENHKRLAGGIEAVLARARSTGIGLPVEVEVESIAELEDALAAGAERILLDNFDVTALGDAVERCRGRAVVEISGGVTLDRMPAISASGAGFVSVGALTHSARAADLSFEIERR